MAEAKLLCGKLVNMQMRQFCVITKKEDWDINVTF